ncbi:MAG: hypothetical protein ABH952_12725 [Candidatus Omnitrophota bacterium]
MGTKKEKIISKAIEILKSNSKGVRFTNLVREIHQEIPEIPVNTIHGTTWNLEKHVPDKVYKAARGLFRHVDFREEEIRQEERKLPSEAKKIREREEDFYGSFASWLVKELEECTKAIPLVNSNSR